MEDGRAFGDCKAGVRATVCDDCQQTQTKGQGGSLRVTKAAKCKQLDLDVLE